MNSYLRFFIFLLLPVVSSKAVAQQYVVKLWENLNGTGRHLFLQDSPSSLDPWEFGNTVSSAKVEREGYVVLFQAKDHTGWAFVLSSNGGPKGDGFYPNLDAYGADWIQSVRFYEDRPPYPYFKWRTARNSAGAYFTADKAVHVYPIHVSKDKIEKYVVKNRSRKFRLSATVTAYKEHSRTNVWTDVLELEPNGKIDLPVYRNWKDERPQVFYEITYSRYLDSDN